MTSHFATLQDLSTQDMRAQIRACAYAGHTAGLGGRRLQANLAILPAESALDFMRFCQRNPRPCPLVGVSDTGNPLMTTLGHDIDVRTDLPGYYIYRDGILDQDVTDITAHWRDDFVAFALGCSFTFEHALIAAGIPMWHITNDTTVPMYRSNIQTERAGPFGGDMVVSMRAIDEKDVPQVFEICRNYPMAHGAPVHAGDPSDIGIADIGAPQWGDPMPLKPGQVPVFWACGVTPQVAIMDAKLPISITHKPGHMLITDIPDDAETTILTTSKEPTGDHP
ncbi:MAG: putative hydro-lyase [Pseudomonadota bacterium]